MIDMYDQYDSVLEKLPTKSTSSLWSTLHKEAILIIIKNFIDKNIKSNDTHVCVSLSGGVDSMIIITCLNYMKINMDYKFNVIAAHVEYANRIESQLEAKFLCQWCKDNDIIFEIKQITEIKRNEMDREDYEEQSRKLRFQLYYDIMNKYKISGVMLGHHAGDIAENVFTNVMHARDLLDLEVIHSVSKNQNVYFWRPLVVVYKDVILEFAHKYHIPYFKDSTPDWSNRGILRKQIFPQLEKRFGGNFQQKLVSIGQQSTEWSFMINQMILDPFIKNNMNIKKHGAYIFIDGYRNAPKCFWGLVFRKILHTMNLSMITSKSLNNVMVALKGNKNMYINLNEHLICMLTGNQILIRKNFHFKEINESMYIDFDTCEGPISINYEINEKVKYTVTRIIIGNGYEINSGHMDYIDGYMRYYIPYSKNILLTTQKGKIDKSVKDNFKEILSSSSIFPLISNDGIIDNPHGYVIKIELLID